MDSDAAQLVVHHVALAGVDPRAYTDAKFEELVDDRPAYTMLQSVEKRQRRRRASVLHGLFSGPGRDQARQQAQRTPVSLWHWLRERPVSEWADYVRRPAATREATAAAAC